MTDLRTQPTTPVCFDSSSLQVWGMARSGYSVKLIGEIDDVWMEFLTHARQALAHRAEFHLDRERGVMAFSNPGERDPQKVLSQLRALLDLTNRWAGRQMPADGAPTSSADEETRRLTKPRLPPAVASKERRNPDWMTPEESRGSSRVGASLMVEFGAGDPVGRNGRSTGMTRDLSGTGVFVHTSRLPSVGDRLNLVVHLTPRNRIGLTGEVIRVLGKDEASDLKIPTGFAARVTDSSSDYASLIESNIRQNEPDSESG